MENFRQQVSENPIWKGMVKTALLTHLKDECPHFDDVIQNSSLWTDTLMLCMV